MSATSSSSRPDARPVRARARAARARATGELNRAECWSPPTCTSRGTLGRIAGVERPRGAALRGAGGRRRAAGPRVLRARAQRRRRADAAPARALRRRRRRATAPRRCGSTAHGCTSIATGARSVAWRRRCCARNRMRADVGDLAALGEAIRARRFPTSEFAEQRTAAAVALLRDLTVIAGGPGTGKTTTVARIVALVQSSPATGPQPLIGAVRADRQGGGAHAGGRRRQRARLDDPPPARLAAGWALPPRRQQPPAPRPGDRR